METFDLSAFLMSKFEEGNILHTDQGYRKKKLLLEEHNIPFQETKVANIVKVSMVSKPVLLLLMTEQDDPDGRLIKIREKEEDDWTPSNLDFFISNYLSKQRSASEDVVPWLMANNVGYEKHTTLDLVIVRSEYKGTKLYMNKRTSDKGLFVVKFSPDSKEYYYSKEKLLEKIWEKPGAVKNTSFRKPRMA